MNFNMYCRPSSTTTISTSSSCSFFVTRPNSTPVRTHPSSSYHHDSHRHHQASSTTPPPPAPRRRRRRLEDPIITYASNYYVTYPRPMPPSPAPVPPIPPPRRIYQQSPGNTSMHCDLFNLLERPSPLVTQTNKSISNNILNPRRHHRRSVDFENAHAKGKNSNERKRHYQPTTYYEERQRPKNNFSSSINQYEQSQDKVKKIGNVYQRHTPSKGFFRRVARTYFCMPITLTNGEYSS